MKPSERWVVTPEERPYTDDLGAALRTLRQHAGLSQPALAAGAGISHSHVWKLEHGERRTRRATLERIAATIVNTEPSLGPVDELVAALCAKAGPSLAAPSKYPRAKRTRRRALVERRAAELAAEMAKPIAEEMVRQWQRTH